MIITTDKTSWSVRFAHNDDHYTAIASDPMISDGAEIHVTVVYPHGIDDLTTIESLLVGMLISALNYGESHNL